MMNLFYINTINKLVADLLTCRKYSYVHYIHIMPNYAYYSRNLEMEQ